MSTPSPSDPVDSVHTFFGIDAGGNCLCGPYMPLGLVRPGPDTRPPQPTSGYQTGDPVCHFSQNHVSGTGGGGRYGNIGILPYSGEPRQALEPRQIGDEYGTVGEYGCTLLPDREQVRITCSHQAVRYDITYAADTPARLRIDLGTVIKVAFSEEEWLGKAYGKSTGGFAEVASPREIFGRADLQGGWGARHPYSVFFFLRLNQDARSHLFMRGSDILTGPYASGPSLAVDLDLGTPVDQLQVEIGISYVSIANARQAVEQEIAGRGFEEIRDANRAAWVPVFDRIHLDGGRDADRELFYSCFYRLYCMPTDRGVNHEMERWSSGVRHFSEFYCLWDSIRNANSLLGLIDPDLHRDMLNCLLDIADHVGWIPDAWIASRIAFSQGGSGADILFAEAALKGLDGIDYNKALAYMRKNAEVDSPEAERSGRLSRAEYQAHGYLREGARNCTSRSIEYANQDMATAILAKHLGQDAVAATYAEASQGPWKLWQDDKQSICPRRSDDTWVEPYDPTRPTRPDFWNCPYFYEGTGIEWTLNMRQDLYGLIDRLGGPEGFETYLDTFFRERICIWKEITLHTPYLYHYVGKPWKSCLTARKLLREKYHSGRDGLSDNEDMGCNSAFVICTMTGLYPEMGRDFYYLIPPLFETVTLQLGGNRTLTIHAPGAREDRIHIRSATLNGAPLETAWVRHAALAEGGTLELELSDTPTGFGSQPPPNARDYL